MPEVGVFLSEVVPGMVMPGGRGVPWRYGCSLASQPGGMGCSCGCLSLPGGSLSPKKCSNDVLLVF